MTRVAEILVVDDDPRSRKLLEGYLAPEGYSIRTAPDGPTALSLIHDRAPDVVLLDIMMPGMTGLEVCKAIKSHPDTRSIQVMMVTALDGTASQVEGLDTGADDYVPKPVRREGFLAKVRALVRARSLVADLERAQAELSARNRELELKKTLAQTIVHDLKNPLTAIIGNIGVMELKDDNPETLQVLERCRRAASRMQKMILDLLDVEGLEEGKYKLRSDPVELRDVVRGTVDEAACILWPRGIKVRGQLSDGPCALKGDPTLLRRVVDNLVANAVAHSPKDGCVTLATAAREEGVEFSVTDQGPGVPEADRERIFEKYSRLDLQGERSTANRGLGLTFCRLAVEAHGGTIWVEDAPEGGAVFRVILPALESGDAEQDAPPTDGIALSA